MRRGGKQHEKELTNATKQLEGEGFRVIDLKGTSPDAIAIKDGKIMAVEVLGYSLRKNKGKHSGGWSQVKKQKNYAMFDDIKIFTFVREQTEMNDNEIQRAIQNILEEALSPLKAEEIVRQLPFAVTHRRINQILAEMEGNGQVKHILREEGKHGRFNVWNIP